MSKRRTLGQIAYEAWAKRTYGRMMQDHIPIYSEIKTSSAWEEIAAAVARKVRRRDAVKKRRAK